MTLVSLEKDYERLTLIVVAEFEASIDRVWHLWDDPRQLERWWARRATRRPWRRTGLPWAERSPVS
jgi:uncharacterized protein YndB with AHSA1/START domain